MSIVYNVEREAHRFSAGQIVHAKRKERILLKAGSEHCVYHATV